MFDRSLLPDALFEFVVIADTHYVVDCETSGVDWLSVESWSARAERALALAGSLTTPFVVHLGDLFQSDQEPGRFEQHVHEVRAQLDRCGVRPYHVAGNMDIGDKHDPTMSAQWVTPESLAAWDGTFGRSWYRFDYEGIHGVVLNSQIMNAALPDAYEQQRWLEADLREHDGERIFLFMHIPPYFIDEDEPGFGYYNSVADPARTWLLDLVRKHRIEFLFAGHTHFVSFNRIAGTRLFALPSTTTTRNFFSEVFSAPAPPDRGRDDVAKLGFFLVRVHADGASVHLIRTSGETEPIEDPITRRRLLTRTPRDLPESPVGLFLRHPLAQSVDGPVTFPSAVRAPLRNDYPLLACTELGARHVRVPAMDLANSRQAARLAALRDEGVQIVGTWIWSDGLDVVAQALQHREQIDGIELQVPGALVPGDACLEQIARCDAELGLPVLLSPLVRARGAANRVHRPRIGYEPEELSELNTWLAGHGVRVARALCRVGRESSPWDVVEAIRGIQPLSHVGTVDLLVDIGAGTEEAEAARAAEAVFAMALLPGSRLYLDPFIALDRTSETGHGLLDRLCNPRPAFHVVRCMNSIVFGRPARYDAVLKQVGDTGMVLGMASQTHELRLLLPSGARPLTWDDSGDQADGGPDGRSYDLQEGTVELFGHGLARNGRASAAVHRPTLLVLPVRLPSDSTVGSGAARRAIAAPVA